MRAVIIGGADCVWSDLEKAEALCDFDILIAVNDAGAEYPGIVDYWVTLHPEHLPRWVNKRRENGFTDAYCTVAHASNSMIGRRNAYPVDDLVPYTWPGSSGLFAVEVAIKRIGADRVVLCGVPMTAVPHFFDHAPWNAVAGFWEAWPAALPHIKGKVRSMSGRTMELLGEPTPEWLVE